MRPGFYLFFLSNTPSQDLFENAQTQFVWQSFCPTSLRLKEIKKISKSSRRVHQYILFDLIFRYIPFRV